MFKKFSIGFLLLIFTGFALASHAQEGIKVVPIGDTIKPEARPAKKKKRRYRAVVIKPGTSFLVELGTALSSGLTQEGETISIRATEDVGPKRRAGILLGATGTATVIKVDKKKKKLVVKFNTIESYRGTPVAISGTIELQGEKSAASAAVGERYTATVDEKIVVKYYRKKKVKPEVIQTAFIEIKGKGAQADIKKGKAKGRVEMVLEAPKGFTADDIQLETVALIKVNGKALASPVKPEERDPKQGDANKNGTTDWTLYFRSWDFIKNQPEGKNTIIVRGNLKNGQPFEAQTRVLIDY